MAQFRITGGSPLRGRLEIAGRKNAALKLIAATVLSTGTVTLRRIPEIADVQVMLEILTAMGASVSDQGSGTYAISTANLTDPVIPAELGRKLRASLVLAGPLLARFGQVTFPHPGGDMIGKRSIAPHLKAFEQMGASIVQNPDSSYTIKAKSLHGDLIYLKEKSVTATENLIMAATRAHGLTTVYEAAEEPHIRNLCDLLRAFGFQISGDGTSMVKIEGRPDHLGSDADITIIPDDIEVGTFAVAAAVTGGDLTLTGVGDKLDMLPILSQMDDFQMNYEYDEAAQTLRVMGSPKLKGTKVQVRPWPGFPPDLQSPFIVLATQAEGTSLIQDWMYEGRLYFVSLLQKMGANIVICDPHRVLVTGPSKLQGGRVLVPDIRAGAALLLAAMAAEGESLIEHTELIERGYARIDERLRSVGAQIVRED
jgi:UDP-N-acetylglucosamine 1-carboxyvinyltransferase